MINTPTGTYEMTRLHNLANGLVRRNEGRWYDARDVVNDFVCLLLEGKTMPATFKAISEKYRKAGSAVNIDTLSDKYLADRSHDKESIRELTPLEKKTLERDYYRKLCQLDEKSQDIMLLKAVGRSDKEIAKAVGLSHANVRVKIHRAILKMKEAPCLQWSE